MPNRPSFTALDASPTHVDFVRRFGSRIYYGDASRVDLLRAAGAEQAELLVLAIDDVEASLRTAKAAQEHFPQLKIVARARNRQHAYALLARGIDPVVRETFAASLDAGRAALELLGWSAAEARETASKFAAYDEEMVRQNVSLREDERALAESAKRYGDELEKTFEADALRGPRG